MASGPASPSTEAPNTTLPAAHLNLLKSWTDFLANIPSCKLRLTSDLSVADDAALHSVGFTTEDWDTDTLHSTSSNTSRITIPTGYAGRWRFEANTAFDVSATGIRWSCLRKNGADIIASTRTNATSALGTQQTVSVEVQMAATDYMELLVRQTSGGALFLLHDAVGPTWFHAKWVGN